MWGILGGIGDVLNERNRRAAEINLATNKEQSAVLLHLAQQTNDPTLQQELMKGGMAAMQAGAGKVHKFDLGKVIQSANNRRWIATGEGDAGYESATAGARAQMGAQTGAQGAEPTATPQVAPQATPQSTPQSAPQMTPPPAPGAGGPATMPQANGAPPSPSSPAQTPTAPSPGMSSVVPTAAVRPTMTAPPVFMNPVAQMQMNAQLEEAKYNREQTGRVDLMKQTQAAEAARQKEVNEALAKTQVDQARQYMALTPPPNADGTPSGGTQYQMSVTGGKASLKPTSPGTGGRPVKGSDIPNHEALGLDPNTMYQPRFKVGGGVDYWPITVTPGMSWEADQNDPTKLRLTMRDKMTGAGSEPATPGVKYNPAMMPTTTSNSNSRDQIVDLGDRKEVMRVGSESTSTRQKLAPGMTPPPQVGARPVAGTAATPGQPITPGTGTRTMTKGLTPFAKMNAEGKLGAFDNTIELVHSVKGKLPMLGSLLDAKKIDMQIDPNQGIIKAFVNRNVPLNAEEAKLAGDFASLMEHINVLRAPLGATGFRGAEAWSALQAQRGQLMANPAVVDQILTRTLAALQSQRNTYASAIGGQGGQPSGGMTPPPAAANGAGGGTGTASITIGGKTYTGTPEQVRQLQRIAAQQGAK